MIEIFFRLFNEALANFVGDPNYKSNPSMICMDEAGANLQGLRRVFGDALVMHLWLDLFPASGTSKNV